MQILRERRQAEVAAAEYARNKEKMDAEIAAIKAKEAKRIEMNDVRKQWRKQSFLTGVDPSPGAQATGGDVFGRSTVTDTVRLLAKQKQRQKKMRDAEAHKLSGLTLLDAASQNKKPGLSSQLIKGLAELKGIRKIKFGKFMRLKALALEMAEPPDLRGDLDLPIRFVTVLSTRTNLKSMVVSDRGIAAIAAELEGDMMMRSMYVPPCCPSFLPSVPAKASPILVPTLTLRNTHTHTHTHTHTQVLACSWHLPHGLRGAGQGSRDNARSYEPGPQQQRRVLRGRHCPCWRRSE